jgi:hypothetical protein
MRPESDIWTLFNVSKDTNGKKTQAECKFCGFQYKFPNATRMTVHIGACKKCPEDVKKRHGSATTAKSRQRGKEETFLIDSASDPDDPQPGSSCMSDLPSPAPASVSAQKRARTSTLTSFVDRMQANEQDKIHEALARAVYASCLPMSLFENRYWKEALSMLRPSYKPPSAYMMGTSLLDDEYGRVMGNVRQLMEQATCLTLLSDGWTNIRGAGVINFIIATPKPVFFKAITRQAEKETAAYIASKFVDVIEEVGKERFLLIVTDNAANMKAAWGIVQEKFPHVSAVGCAAHSINLIFADLLKLRTLNDLYKDCRGIVVHVRNSHMLLSIFNEKRKESACNVTVNTISETRWGKVVIMFDHVLKNKTPLQQSVVDSRADGIVKPDIKKLVLDDSFWDTMAKMKRLLAPVSSSILVVESDTALLSDVVVCFDNIERAVIGSLQDSPFTAEEQHRVRAIVTKRKEFCLRPIHHAAYLLDPRPGRRGSALCESDDVLALEFLTGLARLQGRNAGALLANVAQYRTNTGFFHHSFLQQSAECTAPATWWNGLCRSQPLAPIAAQILSVPPSAASCERNWSAFQRIHTKTRNRTKDANLEKLVAIHTNLKLLDPEPKANENAASMVGAEQDVLASVLGDAGEDSESEESDDDAPLSSFLQ